MKKISYRASAKVIMSGEHAVVYGKPALVTAIDIMLKVTVSDKLIHKQVDSKTKQIIPIIKEYLKAKCERILDRKVYLTIDSNIPIGRGLGSSAALSTAASGALLEFFTGKVFGKEEINSCAYRVEKLFHRNPSGVDTSASSFGGLIFFRKEFEFLKHISSLTIKIPKQIEENLFLIDSGKPVESTAQMVQMVGRLYNNKAKFTESILYRIEKITKQMVISLIKEDKAFFAKTIEENQKALDQLGVVSKKTSRLIKKLTLFGKGKITGAGGKKSGSGYLLFYATTKKELMDYLRMNNIAYLTFKPSFDGVKRIL